jgi:tetratricopeptide (TPR) repeat protein
VQTTLVGALAGALLLSIAASTRPGIAQSQQPADRCAENDQAVSRDQQIEACTAAIESGRWRGAGLAWAYNNRSFAYILRGDYDRGIADADEAIRLDPHDAAAFNNRGNGCSPRASPMFSRTAPAPTRKKAISIAPSPISAP